MTYYGNGYYTITGRSGREYLVSYAGRGRNSTVRPPESWYKPGEHWGLSYTIGAGRSLGSGSARRIDLKARRVVNRWERQARKVQRRQQRDERFVRSR